MILIVAECNVNIRIYIAYFTELGILIVAECNVNENFKTETEPVVEF